MRENSPLGRTGVEFISQRLRLLNEQYMRDGLSAVD